MIGVSLVVAGLMAAIATNFTYWSIEADLAEKRPDLSVNFNGWYTWSKLKKVTSAYKSEFPQGRKARVFWILALGGMTSSLAGFLILVNFK